MSNHKSSQIPEGTLWKAETVLRRCGISYSTLNRRVNDATSDFPKPRRDGTRIRRWRASEVLEWIEKKGEK